MTERSNRKSAGMAVAMRSLGRRKGKPTESDRPPPSTFPGRRIRVLPGQLGLDVDEQK